VTSFAHPPRQGRSLAHLLPAGDEAEHLTEMSHSQWYMFNSLHKADRDSRLNIDRLSGTAVSRFPGRAIHRCNRHRPNRHR
jgi:hypothetical protein